MTPEQVAALLAGLAALGGLSGLGWRLVRAAWRFGRRIDDFLSDWFGEQARPGIPARPGVMERLQTVEKEVTYNDGTSLKDAVRRIELELGTGVDE